MNQIRIKKDIIYKDILSKEINIVHISDIHFNININDKLLTKILKAINNIRPDYIMITGDLIDETSIIKNKLKINELLTFLKDISQIAKVIISLGNHDIITDDDYHFFDKLNEISNIYVLNNQNYHDNCLNVIGYTLPKNYYYNIYHEESLPILLNTLDKYEYLIKENSANNLNIALIHSPIRLTDSNVLPRLQNYDLILSGHTHDGMVPDIIKFIFPKNMGIISPYKNLFPKIARGKLENNIGNKKQTIVISGGITKLSLKSAKILSKMNFIYNIGINRIIIKRKGDINE